MIEKDISYKSFEKKITPYLDGSLSKDEVSEFEAFILTHPEFEKKIKSKKEEIETLREMLPSCELNQDSRESINNEFRFSIFNLLKEEPKGIWDLVKIKWEDWRNL